VESLSRVGYLLVGSLLILGTLSCGSSNNMLTVVAPTANPLVAQYSIRYFHPGLTAWVEFGLDTNYGRQTSVMSDSSAGVEELKILVAGMLPQKTYHMRAHVDWAGGSWVDQDRTFTTGPLPTHTGPGVTVARPTPSLSPAPGVELLSLIAPQGALVFQSLVTDLQGNIIWYYAGLPGTPIKLLQNGHFILNISTDLIEVDLAGTTIRDVSSTQVNQSLQANGYGFTVNSSSFSHDVLVLPNGHWITIVKISKDFDNLPGLPGTTSVLGDGIVDIDLNGNVAWAWSAFDYLQVARALQGLPDWTHANALVYTPEGNLLLSLRNQSWILKIDYANGAGSGNILWTLGEGGSFSLAGGDPSQWFYGQHDPQFLGTNGAETTLAVFDDGNLRLNSANLACGTSPSAPACYSRGTIFQVDESTSAASLLWQDSPGLYTYWGGSIGALSNGDVEFALSEPFGTTSSVIMEVTQTDAPQTVWQMMITGENAYRGDRIPSLYPGVTWQQ
jgi:arylsulfate sulfotransferase